MSGMDHVPSPSVTFAAMVGEKGRQVLQEVFSGEIKASTGVRPLGAAYQEGVIKEVFLSVGASGKDDTNPLSLTATVYKNGSAVCTTDPIIAHVSGEASTNKNTKEVVDATGAAHDTGITQAVVTTVVATKVCAIGDLFSYKLTLTRTATPTTEMSNVAVVVVLDPV